MYEIFIVIIAITLTLKVTLGQEDANIDWCGVKCHNNEKHSVCKLGPYCYSSGCSVVGELIPKNFKDEMVDLHNQLRNKFALGDPQTPEKFQKAADMNTVSWDEHLEYVSACYMRQCIFDHDKCRDTPGFPWDPHGKDKAHGVGQNLYWAYSSSPVKRSVSKLSEDATAGWYDEIKYMPDAMYEKFQHTPTKDNQGVGHFTQLIWSSTTHIGCSWTMRRKGSGYEYFVGCNYGFSGNMIDEPIYTQGAPCSKCAEGAKSNRKLKNLYGLLAPRWVCNAQYKGLCGTVSYARARTIADGIGGAEMLCRLSAFTYLCLVVILLIICC